MREPKAIEEERALLASLLLENGAAIPTAAAALTENDFYRAEHRILYRHIMRLWQEGITPNLITLRTSLKKTDELEKVGASLLVALGDLEFTTAYVDVYIARIKETSNLRRLMNAAVKIHEDAKNDKIESTAILESMEQLVSDIRTNGAIEQLPQLLKASGYYNDVFQQSIDTNAEYTRRSTGFSNIDEVQVFSPGLYVLGGLPALGKTTFAWQLLNQLALNGEKCVYCSYEMSPLELFTKNITAELFKADRQTQLTSAQILRGGKSDAMLKILDAQKKRNDDLFVLELQDENIDKLLRLLRQICLKSERPPIVCLDYLQIVPHALDTAKAGIDSIVRKLKNFQRDTNTTFIIISSFNRANYTQTVSFESFKESGNIEYTADVVWALQLDCMNNLPKEISKAREEIEKAKRETPRRVQLRCLKNRKGNNYDCYFNYYAAHDYFEVSVDYDSMEFNVADDIPEK